RGMNDDGVSAPAKPDDAASRLQLRGILPDHSDAWARLDDVAVGVDLPVAHDNALDGSEPLVTDGSLDLDRGIGHRRGARRGLLRPARRDERKAGDDAVDNRPTRQVEERSVRCDTSHGSSTPRPGRPDLTPCGRLESWRPASRFV